MVFRPISELRPPLTAKTETRNGTLTGSSLPVFEVPSRLTDEGVKKMLGAHSKVKVRH